VKRSVDDGAIFNANIKAKDIIMGITSDGNRYNVDNYGLVKVPWTDKRIPLEDLEFILSLTPGDIVFDVFKWRTKRTHKIKVLPVAIEFQVRDIYHCWEPVNYCLLGGAVFMNLAMNHLEVDEEDEEAYCPPSQAIPLSHFLHDTMNMEKAVVVTHIPAQTHISSQKLLRPFDRIVKVNNKKVRSVEHMEQLIQSAVNTYNVDKGKDESRFIIIETADDKIYLNLTKLVAREATDAMRSHYPNDKCLLLHMKVFSRAKKRKRACY